MDWDFSTPSGFQTRALSRGRLVAPASVNAPAVLFVHGGFHGAWCWSPFLRFLTDVGVTAAAVDLRGHGGLPQEQDFAGQGVAAMAEDVAEAARALGGNVVLAGHSVGALVAMTAARAVMPRGLVMMAPVPSSATLPSFQAGVSVTPPPDARARKWFLQGLGPQTDIQPYLERLCPESPALLNDCYGQHLTPDPAWGDPAWVKGPRLCISGTRDVSPLHPAGSDHEGALSYGAAVASVSGAGHCMMLDGTWRDAAEILRAWLVQNNLV